MDSLKIKKLYLLIALMVILLLPIALYPFTASSSSSSKQSPPSASRPSSSTFQPASKKIIDFFDSCYVKVHYCIRISLYELPNVSEIPVISYSPDPVQFYKCTVTIICNNYVFKNLTVYTNQPNYAVYGANPWDCKLIILSRKEGLLFCAWADSMLIFKVKLAGVYS